MERTAWYNTRWGRSFYWGVIGLTFVGVGLSMGLVELEMRIPSGCICLVFGRDGVCVHEFREAI